MAAFSVLLSLLLVAQSFAANLVKLPTRGVPALAPAAIATLPIRLPAAAVPVPQRVAAMSARVEAGVAGLEKAPGEGASGVVAEQLRVLQGGEADNAASYVSANAAPSLPPPLPPSQREAAVKRMKLGSMAYKFGMESMTTAIPFVAMASLGGATAVALLVVGVYGVAQAVAGSWAGALTDRLPARGLLAGAVLGQGLLVAVTAGLGAAHILAPWALFPIYAVVGLAVGTAETTRRIIPTLVLGQNEEELRQYNASLHRAYEFAGVLGAAGAGAAIWFWGPLAAMAITPAAAAVGAYYFWGVKHARPAGGTETEPSITLREAARLIARDPRLLAVSAAMLLPWVVHRVLENLILPVYAKAALGMEAMSAALLTSSNMGELLGASLLLKWTSKFPGPFRWVRWGAYGAVGLWALSFALSFGATGVWGAALLVAPILIVSLTWAGSHVSLETEVQKRVDAKAQPRVFGLLFGAYVILSAVAAVAVGKLIDVMTLGPALLVVNGLFMAVAMVVWLASRRLK